MARTLQLSELFPEFRGNRGPFPKQEQILSTIRAGYLTGGGAVYQGGKGSGKTIMGAVATIWAHHVPKWRGLLSLIGRESYPSLLTSTGKEFFDMVHQLPDSMVKAATKPSKNSMGYVDWAVGGTTLVCSLSNADTWESANLGWAWVDEAHRQNPRIIGDLESRLRQIEGPRVMLCTTNPAGRGWLYKMAHPDSKERRENWMWVEATSLENPALPQDYKQRLINRYGLNTPAYKRWVLGQSTALEGSVFTEFDEDPNHCIHVIPPIELPKSWVWGRGLDYGIVNPTAVVWAAKDHEGNWWVDDCHYAPEKPEHREFWDVEAHAKEILEKDEKYDPSMVPADPSIFAKIHRDRADGHMYSTADEFYEHGVDLTPADNDRQSGLQMLIDLIRVDPERCHPVTLNEGAPRLFITDRQENEPLIQELLSLLWARPDGTTEQGRPDDSQKKDDHAFDALRYLVKEHPMDWDDDEEEYAPPEKAVVGSRGQHRRY
jgi:PBSX family phage terminase large subunit